MYKKTSIVATIGPSTESKEIIAKLLNEEVNIFRFNFKHNTIAWHTERIKRVNEVARELGKNIGTLIDLQGPEIRIKMPLEELFLVENEEIVLGESTFTNKKQKGFSISHPGIIKHLQPGQILYADDGYFQFELKRKGNVTYLLSRTEGVLKNNKSLNIPGANFPFPVLIERDLEGLKLAMREEIDFVALSFVRSFEDIRILKEEMTNLKLKAKVIAKIETASAIENIDSIIEISDAIMVARGDLGIEVSMEKVPAYQKMIIGKCLEQGKPVITATQMLESMIRNPLPTRAEVSDVANAVYDHTDAVMLSGETATGKYPLQAVKYMSRTLKYTERFVTEDLRSQFNYFVADQESLVAEAAYSLYQKSRRSRLPVMGFIVLTESGRTVNLLTRYRPHVPIYAFCPNHEVADKLSVNYGVKTFIQDNRYKRAHEVTGEHVKAIIKYLKDKELVEVGEKYLVLHGDFWSVTGGSSTVKIIEVD